MQINPPIVLTFTRQRWSSTTFGLSLALLVSRSNIHPHTTSLLIFYLQQYEDSFDTLEGIKVTTSLTQPSHFSLLVQLWSR
jgi:hypothetical protein